MRLYLFLIACLALAASSVYSPSVRAGSVSLPKVGPAPTAAGMGVTQSTTGGSAVTNTPRLSTSTSAGLGNPSATAFGNSAASTPGSGIVRAPAAAGTAASGASGTGAAAAFGAGNVSHGATTNP
jgi:hypothetical protein